MFATLLTAGAVCAQADPALVGHWRINDKLSDDTDDQVEKGMKASGEKVEHSWFDRRKDKYRGGPADQELYDRLSYDPVLTITQQNNSYMFEYADDFRTTIYTDNRSHSVSLNALEQSEDFQLGIWEAGLFLVEMHPRDGGYVNATYALIEGGKRLQAGFVIKPGTFTSEIKLKRVYDRQK